MAADAFDVAGRVAIVTGASSGLGRRFATVLAQRGATVVAAARRGDRLDALAAEVDGITPCVTDVADDAALERLVRFTVERHGAPQIVINNAGVSAVHDAEAEPPSEFRRVVEINLNAVFVLSQLAAREMIGGDGGSIVNIASMMGQIASAPINQASYCASKGGVVNLTRELGAQWARKGVRVNAVAPGFFASEMTDPMIDEEQSMRFLRRNTPMGRVGAEHELDGILLFLASDASSFVTGQTIAVDGGWTAR
jgi:NAD(P)-dependent dehydrogenase (short-subunit alcohol dehydrogenase family)